MQDSTILEGLATREACLGAENRRSLPRHEQVDWRWEHIAFEVEIYLARA